MGGEKLFDNGTGQGAQGSPPRGRGKAAGFAHPAGAQRITPAWAGKSFHPAGRWQTVRDHPRMGGEKFVGPDCFRGETGITPAWAGKRVFDNKLDIANKDHPRMGGEKYSYPSRMRCQSGSPPRGRGKVENVAESSFQHRITPAWAGKRTLALSVLPLSWDHPRVGGEKMDGEGLAAVVQGSPPRGRGKVFLPAAPWSH